nr:MAG TPA: hypothetical protein [Caudoviricetes sp.]
MKAIKGGATLLFAWEKSSLFRDNTKKKEVVE